MRLEMKHCLYIYNSFIASKIIQFVIIIEGLSVLHEPECYGHLAIAQFPTPLFCILYITKCSSKSSNSFVSSKLNYVFLSLTL